MDVQSLPGFPGLIACEFEVSQLVQQIVDRNPSFQARERRPKTKMEAVAECEVRIGIAGDLEALRIRKVPRIMVRRTDPCKDEFPSRDDLIMQLDVAPCDAVHPLHW